MRALLTIIILLVWTTTGLRAMAVLWPIDPNLAIGTAGCFLFAIGRSRSWVREMFP